MVYTMCKAKTDKAMNDHAPTFDPEHWEVIEDVICRKNASRKAWELAFQPVYEKLGERYRCDGYRYRLWNFEKATIQLKELI